MTRSWRDYRAEPSASDGSDDCDNSDVRSDPAASSGAFVPSVTIVTGVPADILAGLGRLKGASAPRLQSPVRWPVAVADALRLAQDGWVTQAIGLGWSALDLFGAVADAQGDPHGDGLAVKLDGRRVLALCATFATVADSVGGRSYLHRGPNAGARLLWDLSKKAPR